jgi:hypothetical protein
LTALSAASLANLSSSLSEEENPSVHKYLH